MLHMTSLQTHIYKPKSNNEPTSMVILFHGYGANGLDLIDLAPYYADSLPDTIFLSPDAPEECEMMPGVATSRQWFSLAQRTPEYMLKGVQSAAPILDSYITEQAEEYNIPSEKIALLGFSQGTMMSLYAAPRYPQKLAGVLGYSGALLWEDDVEPSALQHLPIHLMHGEADDVVPVAAFYDAKDRLEEAGFDVTGATIPGLPHGINEDCIAQGKAFLRRVLG
jgi:phospholipase/carboxylesterase